MRRIKAHDQAELLIALALTLFLPGCSGQMQPYDNNVNPTALAMHDTNAVDDSPNNLPTPIISGNLKMEITDVPNAAFNRVKRNPAPSDINVFRIGPFYAPHLGAATATVTTANHSGKLIVISETPGDISSLSKNRGCFSQGVESAHVRYSANQADLSTNLYCPLGLGKYYYVNVASQSLGGNLPNCTTTSDCGFYFTAH